MATPIVRVGRIPGGRRAALGVAPAGAAPQCRHRAVMVVLIASLVPLASVLTPLDPIEISPRNRNKPPGFEMTFMRNDDGEKYKVEAVMGTDKPRS